MDVYDCVTNPKNSHYNIVKDAIIKFITHEHLHTKPRGFNTSNAIEESLLDFVPFECDDKSSSS